MKTKLLMSCAVMLFLLNATGCSKDEPNTNEQITYSEVARKMPDYNMSLPSDVKAVDLGLSVLWASCNFGATKPLEYGGFFAWGDPTGALWSGEGIGYNNGYTWDTDEYGGNTPPLNISGTKLDVVAQHWGNGWRMPTLHQAMELCNDCQWTLMESNGQKYYRVTGPNGNSIDLPLGGMYGDSGDDGPYRFTTGPHGFAKCGLYWTATPSEPGIENKDQGYIVRDNVYMGWSFVLNSNLGDLTGKNKFLPNLRSLHMSIRPVRHK